MSKLLLPVPELIYTPRLILQMPKAGFGIPLYKAVIDGYEDYVQWLHWPENPPTPDALEEDCRKHHAEFILRDCIRYLILDRTSQQVLGRCAFPSSQADWTIPQFGISYFIRKTVRGQGYATEAVAALSRIAFEILGAKKVQISCDAENRASIRVPQNLGFALEYTQHGGWLKMNGQLADLQTYSLFSLQALPNMDIEW